MCMWFVLQLYYTLVCYGQWCMWIMVKVWNIYLQKNEPNKVLCEMLLVYYMATIRFAVSVLYGYYTFCVCWSVINGHGQWCICEMLLVVSCARITRLWELIILIWLFGWVFFCIFMCAYLCTVLLLLLLMMADADVHSV